jgi:adenylate kinase family enzyme
MYRMISDSTTLNPLGLGVLGLKEPPGSIQRVHIIGGPGCGKSALAGLLGLQLGLAVYSLDLIAFEGLEFKLRPLAARLESVHGIAVQPQWIAEGIFLGWTSELLRAADIIIWLDHVLWYGAAWRIVARFVRGGVEEAKRQPGLRKINRFGDYRRNLRQLGQALRSSRAYYESTARSDDAGDWINSRAATALCLRPYWYKVIHCQNADELRHLVAALSAQRQGTLRDAQSSA